MKVEQRQKAIVSDVMGSGRVPIDTLVRRFGVSRMTIHRDLDDLERRGLVRKERGFVTAEESLVFAGNHLYRAGQARRQKEAIAKAASALVQNKNVVILDDSTTVLAMVPFLTRLESVTVITNFRAVIEGLIGHDHVTVVALGGTYNPTLDAYYGLVTETTLSHLRADIAFLSSPSVIGTALYHPLEASIRLKTAMMTASAMRVLMADSRKFHYRALHGFADLSQFDHVFVDAGLEPGIQDDLRDRQIPLTVV